MGAPYTRESGERTKKNKVLTNFLGVNTQAVRQSINDDEFSWLENAMPIGPGNMKIVPGISSVLATLTGEVVYYSQSFTYGNADYIFAVCVSGAGYLINLSGYAKTTVGVAGTFSGSGARAAQWKNAGLVIIDPNKGYFDWNVTTPGVLTTIDVNTKGTSIATYAGRVWIGNVRTATYTDVNSYNSFAGAGGSTTISDSTLYNNITALLSANNFLYIFGDRSVDVLGDVRVSGGVTSFTRTNITASVGTSLPNTIFPYLRSAMFANPMGFYALTGATPDKVSMNLDGLYQQISLTSNISGGQVSVYNILCAAFLFTFNDIFTPTVGNRPLLALFFNGKWFFSSQASNLTLCVPATVAGVSQLYAWDGANLYQLFSNTMATVASRVQTKLYPGDDSLLDKAILRIGASTTTTGSSTLQQITFAADNENTTSAGTFGIGNAVTFQSVNGGLSFQSSSGALVFVNNGFGFVSTGVSLNGGKYMGMTMTSNAQFSINQLALEYETGARW